MAMNLIETIESRDELSRFFDAVERCGMHSTLRGRGPYTVVAPTDRAFAQMDRALREALFDPQNEEVLKDFVCAHIFNEGMRTEQLEGRQTLAALTGEPVTINTNGAQLQLGEATLVRPNIPCSNGVLHTSDRPVEQPRAIGDVLR